MVNLNIIFNKKVFESLHTGIRLVSLAVGFKPSASIHFIEMPHQFIFWEMFEVCENLFI